MKKNLKIVTRESPLAMQQTQQVIQALKNFWPNLEIEVLPIVTTGDRFLDKKLITIGGKGLFVKELEDALLQNRADLAVHSMKDVPSTLPDSLHIACICARENPFDAWVSTQYDWEKLPLGSIIGTSSLRRQSQLLRLRPDLIVKPLRGNIQTRLKKLETESFDGIVLAAAGLMRMGLNQRIRQIFSTEQMLPACGQGALALECRENDTELQALLKPLHDPDTALCVQIEREINLALGGNCHVPVAIYAHLEPQYRTDGESACNNAEDSSATLTDAQQSDFQRGASERDKGVYSQYMTDGEKACNNAEDSSAKRIHVRARVLNPDGSTCIEANSIGTPEQAPLLTQTMIDQLFAQGAQALLACKA
ncbi:MAG: hydroxymethylbilane synthase [Legionellaceae bacterium]|nr:hydroxymethylbilane synthase [Legionellaceae bacterium]